MQSILRLKIPIMLSIGDSRLYLRLLVLYQEIETSHPLPITIVPIPASVNTSSNKAWGIRPSIM